MVEIEGITCLEKCKNTECGKTPFVLVNDEVISDATLAKVLEKINEIAKQ
jgi:NADH:ubiquinone oxidoreductase subunit E